MKKEKYFYLACGIIMLLSEFLKQWTLTFIVNEGTYNWWYFPFQLCSLPMYICLILPFIKNADIQHALTSFLMDFGLLGGIFAFFDTSGMYYPCPWLTAHSFSWHVLLIIIGVVSGLSFKGSYSLTGYLKCAAIYGTGCVLATVLNLSLHKYGAINMFYISPYYKVTQKIFRQLAETFGNTAGILFYVLTIFAGAGIFHIFWALVHKCGARQIST